jgi:hypothetical protein
LSIGLLESDAGPGQRGDYEVCKDVMTTLSAGRQTGTHCVRGVDARVDDARPTITFRRRRLSLDLPRRALPVALSGESRCKCDDPGDVVYRGEIAQRRFKIR